nr:RHS repeat-associated core domain-containing protein [Nocardioides thalensis]
MLFVVMLAVALGGLSVVPAPLTPQIAAAAEEIDGGNLPDTPSVPVNPLPEVDDPAESIDGLTDSLDDLPTDAETTIPAVSEWADVPAMPVEVRVPAEVAEELPTDPPADEEPESTDEPSPSETASPTPSADPTPEAPTENPAAALDPSETSDPTGEPSSSPTGSPSETSTTTPTTEPSTPVGEAVPEVVVSVEQPADLDVGVVAVEVVAAGEVSPLDLDDPAPEVEMIEPGDPVEGVRVRLDYNDFADIYGGNWADRLVVRAVPVCALEANPVPDCGEGVDVAAINDTGSNTLTFTTLDPALVAAGEDLTEAIDPAAGNDTGREATIEAAAAPAAAGATAYTVSSAPGGYGPAPLSPAGEWQTGVGSGEFSYSYPFQVPPPVGGASPDLALAYSSAAVDGMTTATNGQASPAGVGWVFEPGYISRSYGSCQEDENNPSLGDMCWKEKSGPNGDTLVEELSLSFNGHSGRLIDTRSGDNQYRLKNDPGWRIQRFSGSSDLAVRPSNEDDNDEGFRVTSPDGTEYWFGWGHAGQDSVWTVPVYGNDPGEPCYDANKTAAARWCQQGWRWNLDKIVDTSGNVIRFSYTSEQNVYGRWGRPFDSGARSTYDRGGMLTKVEYGFNGDFGAQQVVDITRERRCTGLLDGAGTCDDPKASPGQWPDVPVDLICYQGSNECPVGPSFFTTNRYDRITTRVRDEGMMRLVDEYKLEYTMPDPDGADGESPRDLWLNKIIRIGHSGTTTATMPAIDFAAVSKNNRIPAGTEPGKYAKMRIDRVHNELGGLIDVDYGHGGPNGSNACDVPYVENRFRWGSDKDCFAVQWSRPSDDKSVFTWFHKYVVTQVSLGDNSLGLGTNWTSNKPVTVAKRRVYDYEYRGNPSWRFAGSNNTPTADESWSDWRGYETTVVHTRKTGPRGDLMEGDVARTKTVRFRGMSGAPQNPDQVENADGAVATSPKYIDSEEHTGENHKSEEDHAWLEGLTAETSILRPLGTLIERTFTDYGVIPTAQDDKLKRQARIRYENSVTTTTQLFDEAGDPTGQRKHSISYDVIGDGVGDPSLEDGALDLLVGAVQTVHDLGDAASGTDGTCEFTDYDSAPGKWIRVPATEQLHNGVCPNRDGDGGGNVVARTQVIYDKGGSLDRGLPTQTKQWTSDVLGWAGLHTINTYATYDTYGRVIETRTPGGSGNVLTTTTNYNPGSGDALPVAEVKTIQHDVLQRENDALNDLISTTHYLPGRGVPTRVVTGASGAQSDDDATTSIAYDPLGRPVDVWLPGRSREHNAGHPSTSYTYSWPVGEIPSRVRTKTLRTDTSPGTAGDEIYDESYTYIDGWGRTLETQVPQPGGSGRIVSVTGYDELGQVRYTMPGVLNPGTPGNALVNPDPATVARYSLTEYDAAGRPISVEDRLPDGTATTVTQYRGDVTEVNAPAIGFTRTQVDVWDRATSVQQFKVNADHATDIVDYTYTARGELSSATKPRLPGSPTWTYTYDMAGRQIKAFDPDTGRTETEYDDAGNPTRVRTFAIGGLANPATVIATRYDRLSRPLVKYDLTDVADPATEAGTVLTEWSYDNRLVPRSAGRLTSVRQPITGIDAVGEAPAIAGAYVTGVTSYDARGQAIKTYETYPASLTGEEATSSDTVTHTTTRSYNQAGLPETVTYPSAPELPPMEVAYSYTTGGRMKTMRIKNSTGDTGLRAAEVGYDDLGRPAEITSGKYTGDTFLTGLRRTYSYESQTGRPNLIRGWITPGAPGGTAGAEYRALELDYAYDPVGNPTHITGTAQTTHGGADTKSTWCYSYDGLNRLVNAKTATTETCSTLVPEGSEHAGATLVVGDSYDLSYTYDADRLTSVAGAGETITYANDNTNGTRPHHTTDLDPTGTLDANTIENWPAELPAPGQIEMDGQGRITAWTRDATEQAPGPMPNKGPISGGISYAYNNLGQLAGVTATDNHSASHTYGYRADGTRLVRRTKDGNKVATTFYRADGTEVTRTHTGTATGVDVDDTSVRNLATLDGVPVAIQTSTTANPAGNADAAWTWPLADTQGSLRLTYEHRSHSEGTIQRPNYYPFGDPVVDGAASVPTTTNGRGYLNKPHDVTGGIRLDHRNYEASFNILTTPDPLLVPSNPQSFNPYAYSANNPIAAVDPSGLRCKDLPVSGNVKTASCGSADPNNNDTDSGSDSGSSGDPYAGLSEDEAAPLDAWTEEGLAAGMSPEEAQQFAFDRYFQTFLSQSGDGGYEKVKKLYCGGAGTSTPLCTGPTLKSFIELVLTASMFVGVGEFGVAGRSGYQALRALLGRGAATSTAPRVVASLDDVMAVLPEGYKLGPWGQMIWGRGTEGARALIGARSADELSQVPGLTVESARVLRSFYQGAVDAGKGGTTAPVRVQLLDDIISRLGG